MLFDYETLKLIWWLLIGALLIGFAIMDGHDFGVCALLPFVGKSDIERRTIINTIGAHWEGNQVWFITAGGAIFAAFPLIYATAFSGFYWALIAALWALFLRPVGFKYRSLMPSENWRSAWDWALFSASVIPAFIFGVAFGNLFLGVPFYFNDILISTYTGSFFGLLRSFALLCGVVSVSMLVMHGGIYLAHRSLGDIQARAIHYSSLGAGVFVIAFIAAGIWVAGLDGYVITSPVDTGTALSPIDKSVHLSQGAWLANFSAAPMLWAFPALGIGMALLSVALLRMKRTLLAFITSSLMLLGVIMTAGTALFPFLLPSSSHPSHSLTLWDSVSSQLTLTIMLIATAVFLPAVVAYTSWAYRVMRGKVTPDDIINNSTSRY